MADSQDSPTSESQPSLTDSMTELSSGAESGSADIDDVYAQLAQKEQDLILAAELGKALLDSNQEIQSRYDQMVESCNRKVERLEQEKYDLHLELEKMETEYQNTIKDLQEDLTALRKQARNADEIESSERERNRSLREAQQTSDYLLEQVKEATMREEEMEKELNNLRVQNESQQATIHDQTDHITMLREQVEYLSEKLRETNQLLLEIQVERDNMASALEAAQEKLQDLEDQGSLKDKQINRQASEIEELQESYCELQQQLHQRRSIMQHHHHPHFTSAPAGTPTVKAATRLKVQRSSSTTTTQPLFEELTQSELRLFSPNSDKNERTSFSEDSDETDGKVKGNSCNINEHSLLQEFSSLPPTHTSDRAASGPASASLDPSPINRHRRNISDGSISSITEGSRKRHHVGDDSDEEADDHQKDSHGRGTKQTFYSKSVSKNTSSNNENKTVKKSPEKSPCKADISTDSSDRGSTNSSTGQVALIKHEEKVSSESAVNVDSNKSQNTSSSTSTQITRKDTVQPEYLYSNLVPQFELACDVNTSYDSQGSNPSEHGSVGTYEQEQSLFSELSSQLLEDKRRTQSLESNSSCMLGAFDFSSGVGSQDSTIALSQQDTVTESVGRASRIDSDMGYGTDWHNVTSEMVEEDDFECDDDDFLMGNLAGTTLSISDNRSGPLLFPYNHYYEEDSIEEDDALTGSPNIGFYSDSLDSSNEKEEKADEKQQEKLAKACAELRELVLRVQGQQETKDTLPAVATLDNLLHLVKQMRVCVDKLTGTEASTDIYSTKEASITTDPSQASPKQLVDAVNLVAESQIAHMWKQDQDIKKSHSSASLLIRKSL